MENNHEDRDSILFVDLILSLSSMAVQLLGKTINPETGKIERNITKAQATIDILAMLKTKTRGNLSKREQDMLDTTLSTLQLNYFDELEIGKKQSADPDNDENVER
ncbi:MAG: DUF1844 domain-containing protein [Candidatus Firestonebacteria bacterium]|nr:DUF1844 domain-containing protein [Candidatus Firestonebacteria bacterium]